MEIIPSIKMKKRKILNNNITSDDFLNQITEDQILYILDIDGIDKDKPNLCTYQRLSKTHNLWVDFGPRNLGDVVDAFMAGVSRITIRRELCMQLTIQNIKEITENQVYSNINFEKQNQKVDGDLFYQESDGLVNFNNKEKIELDFKYGEFLRYISLKNNIYSYESDPINMSFWKNFNIKGLIVDIEKLEEFEKYGN